MRKHKRRRRRSGNARLGQVVLPKLRRHELSVVDSGNMSPSDNQANVEGLAIIRRGKSASDNKAWHDSLLWNTNVRKTWIRRMLELSDEAKRKSVFRLTHG